MLHKAAGFVLVALCWGFTNPFIARDSRGLETVKRETALRQFLAEWPFLATRWQYVLPLAINLSGSVVYFYMLGKADLSLAMPIANALILFTSLGELALPPLPSPSTLVSAEAASKSGVENVKQDVAAAAAQTPRDEHGSTTDDGLRPS